MKIVNFGRLLKTFKIIRTLLELDILKTKYLSAGGPAGRDGAAKHELDAVNRMSAGEPPGRLRKALVDWAKHLVA